MNKLKNKIITLGDIPHKDFGNSILCYGHFDLIHPGHIRHLEYARRENHTLIVAIRDEQNIVLGDHEYLFSSEERAINLAALELVDYVIILRNVKVTDLISQLKPKSMVLGKEFEDRRNKEIDAAILALEAYGGVALYHGGEVQYSLSALSNNSVEDAQRELNFIKSCKQQKIKKEDLLRVISNFKNTSLLVIGDTILDQYVACEAVGMSAEAPVVVMKELDDDNFLGGAGIVASHISSLGSKCHYLSVVGADKGAENASKFLDKTKVDHSLFVDQSRPTTLKVRYLVEKQKVFRFSRLKDHNLSLKIEKKLIKKIEELILKVDGVLISDFLYGVITPRILNTIITLSKKYDKQVYCDLQCSSQIGSIMKFSDVALLCPTEREARVAISSKDDGVEWVANQILNGTSADNLVMKLGAQGFIAYETKEKRLINRQYFPALSSNPKDVTGAGDSLLAALALCLSSGANLMNAGAIGAIVASMAVENIGNEPISIHMLLDKIESVNF